MDKITISYGEKVPMTVFRDKKSKFHKSIPITPLNIKMMLKTKVLRRLI